MVFIFIKGCPLVLEQKVQNNGTLDKDWVSSSVLARKFKLVRHSTHFSNRNFFCEKETEKSSVNTQ